jgi:signal transduction histidine kinase
LRHSVATRILTLITVVAAALAVTLALFFVAQNDLRRANQATTRAADVTGAGLNLRAQVASLDRSFNEALHSRSATTLFDWRRARDAWQQASAQLTGVVQTPAQREHSLRIRALIRAYVTDYANPVLDIAEVSPSTASSSAVTQEGRLRLSAITQQIDSVTAAATRSAAIRSRHADAFASRARTAGLVALIVTPLLLLLAGLWLMRSVVLPLRAAVGAASSVAAGDFSARLPAARKDEFGSLAAAFNRMTSVLGANRDELVARAQRLEESEQRKSELVSIVSHEVRTPLASILGFARLLLEREVDEEERREYLRIIDEEATRLASLVSDFLDIRLLEDQRFPLRSNHIDIRPIVAEQARRMLGRDEDHVLDLHVGDAPVIVLGDQQRLTQVVTNLLSNAAKFSPSGGRITVGLQTSLRRVRVYVEDQGPGIAPEHADRLFEPFFRGGAPAAGIPGAGIGLALSRRIIEAHGGRIGFENLRNGTRFWFELPWLPDQTVDEPVDPSLVAS